MHMMTANNERTKNNQGDVKNALIDSKFAIVFTINPIIAINMAKIQVLIVHNLSFIVSALSLKYFQRFI